MVEDSSLYMYVRDAGGNVLSIYLKDNIESENSFTFVQNELNLYGYNSIGVYKVPSRSMTDNNISRITTRYRNYRHYENSNHLGNIMTVYSDRVKGILGQTQQKALYYEADLVSANDYYPFGQVMRTRHYPNNGGVNGFFTRHRYGFNGKEADYEGEINTLNTYDYGFRIYNPGTARFLSVDPMAEARSWLTPYNYVQNNPLNRIDPTGALDWKPDEDGNLIAEKGDNTASLAKFLNVSKGKANEILNNQGGVKRENYVERDANILEGQKVELNNQYTRAIKNSDNSGDINGHDSNCHGCSLLGSAGKELGGDRSAYQVDKELKRNYDPVNPSQAKFGSTIIRFGGRDLFFPDEGDNTAQHSVIFYGRSKEGTEYGFTKNGYGAKPAILPISEIQNIYKNVDYGSSIKGINPSSSGYYNRRK